MMKTHAPLLPYVIAFWLGTCLGLCALSVGHFILIVWTIAGCWIGFKWSLHFTLNRFLLFLVCSGLGFVRASNYLERVTTQEGDLVVLSLKSCKPQPIQHGRNIYSYARTNDLGKVGLVWPNSLPFPSANSVAIGRWYPYKEAQVGTFNVKRYYESLGCNGVFIPLHSILTDSAFPISTSYRLKMKNRLEIAGVDKHALGFMMGLSTGDKSLLSTKVKSLFSKAGLSHLLAVSGYHVGLIGFVPLLFIRSRRRELKFMSGFGLVVIWSFILACGSPWSAIRSGIMVTVSVVGKLASQSVHPWQALCVAAWIVAWIDPYSPQQLGTQLSFAATAGILTVVSKPKWLLIRIPIAAQLSTLAWLACVFQTLPIFFLPLNVIASLLVSVVGALIGLGSMALCIHTEVGNGMLRLGGFVASKSIEGLERLESMTHLEMTVVSPDNFVAASLSGVAWLFKDTIPLLLSRCVSGAALCYVVFNFLVKFK